MLSRYTSSFHGFWQVGPARFWVRRTFCQSYRQHSGYTHGIFEQDSNSSLKQILPLWTVTELQWFTHVASSVWYVSEPEFLQLKPGAMTRTYPILKYFGYCKPKLANTQLWYLLRPNLEKWSTISIRNNLQMASAPTYFLCLAIGLMMVIITYIKVIIFEA